MEYEGTLRFVDLGPGQWVLELDEDEQVALVGAVPAALQDQDVVVTGRRVDVVSFGRGAERAIEVRSVRKFE